MTAELEEYLVEHARREGYSTSTRPRVTIETEPDLTVGMFGIAVATGRTRTERRPPGCPRSHPPWPPPVPPLGPPPSPSMSATMIYAPEPEPEPRARADEQAVLEWTGGSRALTEHVTTIGRSSDCQVVLSDPNVSRRHAEIRHIGEGYSLIDLGSTNGTEVNGQRVGGDGAYERGCDQRGPDQAHVRAPPWLSSFCWR